jgi:hypothetical protein
MTEILKPQGPKPKPTSAFEKLDEFLRKYFFEPDVQAIRIALGVMKTHYMSIGDPPWLFIVAPPGSGKTTITIMGASGLPEVVQVGDLTENTLLSGFHGAKEPGMLEKLGTTEQSGNTYTTKGNGVFLVKDFTTVLSMKSEKRAAILGQLREIHDGEFKKDFGTGVTKIWKGKVTIVAAVTPALDRHYSIFSTLGERFLQIRWHRPSSEEAGVWAMKQQGKEAEIRKQAQASVKEIFDNSLNTPPTLPEAMQERLAALGEVVAIGRTHVYRSGYGNKDIEHVPEPEANTRVSKGMAAIARGVAALQRHAEVAEEDLQDAMRVGLDCLPVDRRKLLTAVAMGQDPSKVQMSRSVRERQLEELTEHGLLGSCGTPKKWRLTPKADRLISKAKVRLS